MLLPSSGGCPPGQGCFVSTTSRCRPPPCKGRDLHWSSFLNKFEAGNSRVCFSRVPLIPDKAKAEAAASAEAVAWA